MTTTSAAFAAFLKDEGLTDNTIFVFTTDNGTKTGHKIFNAGMRGKKTSEYDGGHRVPLFIHWPAGGLVGGRDVEPITAHVDLFPTLIDLCEITQPKGVNFDGRSIRPLLEGSVLRIRTYQSQISLMAQGGGLEGLAGLITGTVSTLAS